MPQGAVGLAYLLVMASIIVFVFFVHSTVRSMRVTYVIQAVFRETVGSATNTFAEAAAYVDAEPPEELPAVANESDSNMRDAVLDGIDAYGLVELAAAHGCVLRLTVPVGTYLPRDFELMEVLGGTRPDPHAIGRMLHSSAARTIYQDPSYGVRQLVDIAIRALSPPINDPTTAVEALDRLHGILRAVANRPDPSGLYVDAHGTVRLIVPGAGVGPPRRARLHRGRACSGRARRR